MKTGTKNPATTLDTRTGLRVDFAELAPDMFALPDVASALSKLCRFGGHCRSFYSVAQHSVLVSRIVIAMGRPDLALVALHHDSHEAYVSDIPSPLKRYLDRQGGLEPYVALVDAVDAAIRASLEIPVQHLGPADWEVIERADRDALAIEARSLLPAVGLSLRDQGSTSWTRRGLKPLSPRRAELLFIEADERARLELVDFRAAD